MLGCDLQSSIVSERINMRPPLQVIGLIFRAWKAGGSFVTFLKSLVHYSWADSSAKSSSNRVNEQIGLMRTCSDLADARKGRRFNLRRALA